MNGLAPREFQLSVGVQRIKSFMESDVVTAEEAEHWCRLGNRPRSIKGGVVFEQVFTAFRNTATSISALPTRKSVR